MRELEKKLDYTFHDAALLEEALNHSSYANEHRAEVLLNGQALGTGDGHSKKEAEQAAAKAALAALGAE